MIFRRRGAGPCGYCHVGDLANRIYEGLRGVRPAGELVRVWEDDSGIVGVAICLRFGAAFDVFTDPGLRGTSAELEMLRSAFETTARHTPRPGWRAVGHHRCLRVRRRPGQSC